MKTLKKNVKLDIAGLYCTADILLAVYHEGKRPAILLVDSRPDDYPGEHAWLGEPIACASTNAPAEYLQHLPTTYFASKNWSENEGLWEQLEPLEDPTGERLFSPTTTRITLGFVKSQIYNLSPWAISLYEEEVASLLKDYKEQA